MTRRDYRDGVIEALADSEYVLACDLAGCREALHVAAEQLYEMTRQLGLLREQHRRLHDEYRSLRETILRNEERAA